MPPPIDIIKLDASHSTPKQNNEAWKLQLANAVKSPAELLERLQLTHINHLVDHSPGFRCLVTENYLAKIKPGDPDDPLLRQVLPLEDEHDPKLQNAAMTDPVGDLNAHATAGMLHKYHGRALIITTAACAIHCRYCFRQHYPYSNETLTPHALKQALNYLRLHEEIHEVILSGGDPLVLDDEKLASLIHSLEQVPHLQILRLHSRLPIVLPERITDSLISILGNSRLDVVMVIHANHAGEIQSDEEQVLQALDRAGVSLLNQSVLLKGVNDNEHSLSHLSQRLLQCKTLPYYLHMLDPVAGAMHFNVSTERALKIHQDMQNSLPGYLVPRLVREIAGKRSKTAIFNI